MNNVSLIGRITKDVELRYSPSGVAVAKFTLAVNRAFKKDGEQEADFIRVTIFKKTAENTANFCKKGSLVGIVGQIQTGSYDDKDGKKVYTTEVLANNVQFLDTRSQNDTQQGGYQQPQYQQNNYQPSQQRQGNYNNSAQGNEPFAQGNVNVSDDDLPF